MDNQPPSIIPKPLHGYKNLIRGQVCRLRDKSQQPTGSSSPQSKTLVESSDDSPLQETVIKVSCHQQWQEEDSVPTRPSIDVRWKGTSCQAEATRETATQDSNRNDKSLVNCQAQLTPTDSLEENSIEEKQERYIRDALLLDDADQGTMRNITEKTPQTTGDIGGSRCEPFSDASKSSHHSLPTIREGQDGGSHSGAIATGLPLNLRTTQEPGLKNDGSNISVVIDDPLTVDLLLAEQGQLFHTGEAIRTSIELMRDASSMNKSRNVSIISTTQQVEVAVRNRTVTEASITTFSEKVTENRFVYSSVSTETRIAPRLTSTLMKEGRNLRQILGKRKISREKHVRFADEVDNLKLCATASCRETALPSGVEHQYRIDITPLCVGTPHTDVKSKGREQLDQKGYRHYRQESRIESAHLSNAQESTAAQHGGPKDVGNDAVRDSKTDPELGTKAFGIKGKTQENKMPMIPTLDPCSATNVLKSLPNRAMPSGVDHPQAHRKDITPQYVGTLSKTKRRQQSDQQSNKHYRQEARVETVHNNAQENAIIHPGNPQDVGNDAVRVDSTPDPELGNNAFGMDGVDVKAPDQQENTIPRLTTPRSSANALGSLSISNRSTTFVSPAVGTKHSSLSKPAVPIISQSAENARFPPKTDSVFSAKRKNGKVGTTVTSSFEKVVTPFKTRGVTTSGVRAAVPDVPNRVLQISRSEPVTSRRPRRGHAPISPVYRRHKCRNGLAFLSRLGVIIFILVLVVQALAFFLALGFVTECDSDSVLISPLWGFSWIQFDVTPLASLVRQHLQLVNYRAPPT
ncbi:uncharacterized protein [Asterias amurensis]|uniref:uncharacterized protein n=1 Tax=Asterias amurensis TaxID=7602 RepID=UPI003AB78744